MALQGSAPALRCSCRGTLSGGLIVQALQSRTCLNSRAHGIGRVTVWTQRISVSEKLGWDMV